jgi:multiple sugar transport system permease protein
MNKLDGTNGAAESLRPLFSRTYVRVFLSAVLILGTAVLSLLPFPTSIKITSASAVFLVLFVLWLPRVPERLFPYALSVPSLLILMAITLVPIGFLVWVSLHRVTLVNFRKDWPFTGLDNYLFLAREDPLFIPCLVRSLQLLFFGLIFQLVLGMGLAVLLNRKFRFRNLVGTVLLLPVMTNSIVIGMLWKYMLSYYNGFINLLLIKFGIPAQPWLTNQVLPGVSRLPVVGAWLGQNLNLNFAFFSIIATNTWQWTPMVFLLLSAGLASLPSEPFEAAKVDGASGWQTFRYLTLPMLKPVIKVVLVIRGIDIMKTFGMIWALFGNASITSTLNIHIHTVGLYTHNYGRSSALSLLVVGLTLLLYLLFQKLFPEGDTQ